MDTIDNQLLKLLEKISEIYAPTTTTKLGRPYAFSELLMLKGFLLMTLKKIKQFAALYRYLKAHPKARAACGLGRMPDGETIRKRLKKLAPTLKLLLMLHQVARG
jgi:transposase